MAISDTPLSRSLIKLTAFCTGASNGWPLFAFSPTQYGPPLRTGRQRSRPIDLVEQAAQFLTAPAVHVLDPSYAAIEVAAKIRMRASVLAFQTEADAIVECRLQGVELCPGDVQVLVDDEAGQILALTLPHDAGLVPVWHEAFVLDHPRDATEHGIDPPGKIVIAGKRQIIGIARVSGIQMPCKARQSGVNAQRAQVRDCR